MIRTVGFVGAGKHVRDVLMPSAVAAGLSPRAVVARTFDSAQAAARPYGARAFLTCEELIASSDVEAVVVAIPPDQLGQVMPAVIASRMPCYVEKPASMSSAEADRLADLADDFACRVHVGFMKRYAPAYLRMFEAGSRGDLGPLSLTTIRWAMGPFGGNRELADWLIENAVHAFDLARYFIGDVDIRNVLIKTMCGEHVVLVHGMGQSGTLLALQLCTTGPWWHDNETVEAFGNGSSLLARNATELIVRRNDGPEEVWRPNFTIPVDRNLTGTLLGFTPALRAFAAPDDAPIPAPSLRDAAAALALVERVLDTAADAHES